MKVTRTGGVSPATGARPAQGGGPGGPDFRIGAVPAPGGSTPAASVSAAAGVIGVEALLALQAVGSPTERRRRSVARAGRILDVLEEVKLALLEGELDGSELDRLRRVVRDERGATEDPRLEAVLDEIETRAAVEMAKLELSQRAA